MGYNIYRIKFRRKVVTRVKKRGGEVKSLHTLTDTFTKVNNSSKL